MAAIRKEENKNEVVNTNVEVEDTKEVVPAKKNTKTKVQLDLKMMVPCRNITAGSLTYISKKSGVEVNWNEPNDEEYIDVAELLTMKSSQPRFLNEPWVMIDDEEVIEYLGLKRIYDSIIDPEDIDSLLLMSPVEIQERLKKAPNGTRESVSIRARQMVENQELYDIRVIKILERELNIDLSMIS
jgi:hypothetical protein